MKMRTINEASAYLVEQDPETAITKTAIRRLIVSGAVPSVRIGNKYLVDVDLLEKYLSVGIKQASCTLSNQNNIRKLEV